MLGVQSFWSRPHLDNHDNYSEPWLMLWALSVAKARKIFDRFILVTDKPGALLFKDFPYDEIRLDLEEPFLPETARHAWAAGKLITYQNMTEEFCHVDGDVILHQEPYIFGADIFAQSDEAFITPVTKPYRDDPISNILQGLYLDNGFSSVPWVPGYCRHRMYRALQKPYNVGIFGGRDLDFIHRYAEDALAVIRHPLNQPEWADKDGVVISCYAEQYLLGAKALYENRYVAVLFPNVTTQNEAFMRDIGYSHLFGESKHNLELMQRVYRRMETEFLYLYKVVKAMKLPKETTVKKGRRYYCSR